MLCKNCGQKNDKDGKFCIKCGFTLKPSGKKRVEDILFVPQKESKKTTTNWLLNIFALTVIGLVIFVIIASYSESDSSNSVSSSAISPEVADEWQPFTSVEHGFKINFPSYPSTDRTPIAEEQGISYSSTQYSSSDKDDVTYLAQVADYDIAPDYYENKTGLEGIINSLNQPGEQIITSSYITKFHGYDATSFEATNIKENYYMKGIAFIKDDLQTIKAYLLLVGSNINKFSNYQNFINSLELK